MPQIESLLKFSDNFTSVVESWKNRNLKESQFSRDLDFRNRQLGLREAFRRDELDETISYHKVLSEYYDAQGEGRDLDRDVNIQRGKNQLMMNDMFPVDESTPEGTSTFEAYGETYAIPVSPEKESTFGSIGSGFFGETKFEDGKVVGFEDVRQSPYIGSGGGDGTADISNEVGEVNKLLEIYKGFESDSDKIEVNLPSGETAQWDKTLWRANAKRYTTDILEKSGINPQGDYLADIRTDAGVVAYGKNQWESFSNEQKKDIATHRETALLDEINKRRVRGEITEQRYQALRYWAIVGSK